MKNLKIATRNSTLALWQANHIKHLLKAKHNDLRCEIIPFITQGDKDKTLSLKHMGGKGAFVKELELALIERRADIAVHSMKDVPAILPNELEIASIAPRHNLEKRGEHYNQRPQKYRKRYKKRKSILVLRT